MTRTAIVLVLGAEALSVLGQLLLKSGAKQLTGLGDMAYLLSSARNVRVLSGLLAWIVSTFCWLYVLRVAPLARVYALTSLTYVLVPLAGVYLFDEDLRRQHMIGIAMISFGIVCVLLPGD